MRERLDLLLMAVITVVLVALSAAIADRGYSQALPAGAPAALPGVTPGITPTSGWWAQVPVTATPNLPSLPGLPKVSLSRGSAGLAAGTPVPYDVLSCPTASVQITAVMTGGKPGWWNIIGTAALPDQAYWKGELSADGQGWTMLYHATQPVREGLLIEFNTRTVPPGAYQIRLLAVDRTGNYPEPCVIRITIQ